MRTRKVLSIILALAMILTMAPISVGSFALDSVSVGSETVDINTAQNDELVRPNATVEVTPVTRACFSLSSPLKPAASGSCVVTAATPSGIAKNSYTFASALYGGETPVSTTIKFTPGVEIDTTSLGITCSNSSVTLTGPTSPSAGVYVWTVNDGASVALGEVLTFSVTYKYEYKLTTDGKTYNKDKIFTTTGYSYVESVVSPAGQYSHRRTYISYGLGSKNVNRSYVASYILGAGVYTSSTTTGAFDPSSGSGTDSSDYGRLLYTTTSGTPKYNNPGYKADSNRPVSIVYYDVDKGSTLAAQNVRFVTTMPQQASESDQKTSINVAGLYEYSGAVQTFSDSDSEGRSISSSNTTALGLTATSEATTGISSVGQWFSIPLSGTGPSDSVAMFTALLDFQTPGYWSSVYTRHSHTLTIVKVDKGALRTKLQSVVNADVSGPLVTDVSTGKGYNPQSWYYTSGWANYATAYADAQRVYDKPNATSEEISNATATLTSAYDALVLADADYTELDTYYNQALALNKNNYDPSTWAVLETALAKYETGYSILYQPKVDALATEIKNAINNLRYNDADYSAVDEKVDVINGIIQDLRSDYDLSPSEYYTNWSLVTEALTNCGYYYDDAAEAYVLDPDKTKTVADQAVVDGYPLILQTALNQLTVRTADYTATRTALAAYTSFSTSTAAYVTAESLQTINSAYTTLYNLYSPAKSVAYQPQIDAAVAALNDALANYEYRDADYTAANTAKQAYLALDRSIYTDLSAVDSAYQALVALDGLDARSQSQIDAAVKTLNNAMKALQKNAADYTAVNAAIAAANAENERITNLYAGSLGLTAATFYSNWSAVTSAINAVNWNLDVTNQAQVDAYAAAINSALNALTEKDADYTALNTAVDTAYTYFDDTVASKYTDESIEALMDAVFAVVYGKKISEQATVNGYTEAILDAIDNLQLLPADYTAVNTAIAAANAKKTQSEQFAAAHHGYPYYTAASIANLDSKINAVVWNLDTSKQTQVNNYATAINNAVTALVIAPADYTDVEAAKATVPADLSVYTDASKVALTSALAYNTNLKANSQATVDGYDDAIYTAIANLKYKPIDTTAFNNAKATIPADLSPYTIESAAAVTNQVAVINNFLKGSVDIRNQADLDSMVADLNTKIAALELQPLGADYSAVETAKTVANSALTGSEAQYYTDASKQAVTDAVNAVVYDLLETEQARVDGFATAINNAVAALAYKPIDTTNYNAAVAAYDAIADKTIYTAASLKAVTDKIAEGEALINGGANIKDQASLDVITAAINDAIANLALNGADYTAVETAKAAAQTALASEDAQFYTDESKQAVTDAVNAVVYGLLNNEQATVDGFATAINNAVAALAFKPIDRTGYDAAVQRYEAVQNKSNYTDASISAVTSKIAEGSTLLAGNVNAKNQAQLDTIVANINTAIDNLALKDADYTALNDAINTFLALDEDLFTNYEDVYDVYATVRSWKSSNGSLKVTDQSLIDEKTATLVAAIDSLQYKDIDTTAYVAAKATIPATLSNYTDATANAVTNQVSTIDAFLANDVDVRDQADLDSMVADLNTKIAALVLKNADYTALNDVIAEFLDLNEDDYSNYEDAYDVYASVRTWKTKNGNLKIDSQSLVDAQTALLREAIDSLIGRPIDTAAYVAAKATIPADLTVYTDATVQAVNDQVAAIDTFLAGDVDFRDQATLDAMVADLNTKIAALAYKPADYTALNAVMAEFLDIDETLYSNYDDAYDVYATVRSWKNSNSSLMANNQSLIDEKTALLRAAIDGLTPVTPQEPEEYFKAREGSTTKIATNGQITGLKTELTRGDLENIFLDTNVANITFKKAVKSARYYGTGSTITVNYSNGTTEVYTIVVYGDVDGNGIIDYDDAALTDSATEDSTILGSAQSKAANVDGVRRVTANDAAIIYLAAQGLVLDQLNPSNIG